MSASDKARYYLEQSIPELQQYEKKGIFSQDEIVAITKKRTDFEHRISASGCTPLDFTRYATFEMNLHSLYLTRSRRLKLKSRLHFGARRVFFILDRAVRKFPGSIPLWLQYIDFARKEKASNVLAKTFAQVLKLHPTKPELWIEAARHAVEGNADVTEARSHMQRGLRFCRQSRELWREYAKLEMNFVAKVYMRRELLGIDAPRKEVEESRGVEDGDDTLMLPSVTKEEMNPELQKKDQSLDLMALENIDTNPALNGALAIAIFDEAMRAVPNDIPFAQSFFELFCEFGRLRFVPKILEHVLEYMLSVSPHRPDVLWVAVKMPVVGVEVTDAAFPGRLQKALGNMEEALKDVEGRRELYALFITYFAGVLRDQTEMDPAVERVLTASVVKYWKQAEAEGEINAGMYGEWARFNGRRDKAGLALRIAQRGLGKFPGDEELQRIVSEIEESA